MRLRLGALVITSTLACFAVVASAGPIQIKLYDSSRYNDWICGATGPPTLPGNHALCGSAGFGKCSDCPPVLVRNDSRSPVRLTFTASGPGFQPACESAYFLLKFGSIRCSSGKTIRVRSDMKQCGPSLAPGASCIAPPYQFCPEQAGPVRGTIDVSVRTHSGAERTSRFALSGTGNYPRDLARADRAIHRHLAELMSLSHVAKVALDTRDNTITIDVEVVQGHPLEPVRRAVPPKIGGYWTEVTYYSPVGCGY